MKGLLGISVLFSFFAISIPAQAQKSVYDNQPVGTLVRTENVSLARDYTLESLASLAKIGIDTNAEISLYQATASNICSGLQLPWVPPKENNPFYWSMIGAQFASKTAIKNAKGTIIGYRYVSNVQCGLFDRTPPPCSGKMC